MTTMGIDLGTTFSCVSIFRNRKAEVLTNDMGKNTTPSCVAFKDGERVVGEAARNYQLIDPHNCVYDAKRLIGRKFSEEQIQADIQTWPFQVKGDANDIPKIVVQENGKDAEFFAEQISAMVLRKMVQTANLHTTKDINRAVITVPAYFNNAQREATRAAARIAGLEVLSIINEPTAAAIAYGCIDRADQTILVYDLGGGTLDVTILKVVKNGSKRDFKVLATKGDVHLGGEDFDQILLQFSLEKLQKNYNVDLSRNGKARQTIRRACENAKKNLSQAISTNINFSINGTNYDIPITRSDFEYRCDDLLSRCTEPIDLALETAHLEPSDIDNIILVGGSSHIPWVKNSVEEYFDGKKAFFGLNPDEAVAQGAAIFAERLVKGENSDDEDSEGFIEAVGDIEIYDIVPRALGTTTTGDVFTIIVPEGSAIPGEWSQTFSTASDNQTGMRNEIREEIIKDDTVSSHQHLLDVFQVSGIKPAPKGTQKVKDIYKIDRSGILHVESIVLASGESYKLDIKPQQYQHSADDIERMKAEHDRYVHAEDEIKRRANALDQIDQILLNKINEKKGTPSESRLRAYRQEVRQWIETNRQASLSEIDAKTREVKRRIASM